MRLKQSFDDFLRNTVSLDETRRNRVQRAHQFVREKLTAIDEVAERKTGRGTYLQGSYPLHTAVRPCDANEAYDVDVVLAADFRKEDGRMIPGRRALRWLQDCLESIGTYQGKTMRKSCCVRIDYESDDQRFHLDVVPAHQPDTLQGPIKIPPNWSRSDPRGYIDWFRDQCKEADDWLLHVVRLLKYWRNLQGITSNSMILTTLAAHHSPAEAESLDDALVKTMSSIKDWMQSQTLARVEVPNPSMPEENLAQNWPVHHQRRFRNRLSVALETAEEALDSTDEEETINLWNRPELFDGRFPKTVRGLAEKAKEKAAAMGSGGLAVGPSGQVSTGPDRSGRDVPDNGGFYGDK
jgi:hypothetical protein